jgi:F420-dependent oxidoreductase-like protein
MKTGIHYSNFTMPGGAEATARTLAATAKAADEGGLAKFTVMDHFFQIEQVGPPTDPMHEAYTTLGFVAGATERIQLGVLATGVTYRHPGLLAQTVTTLDVLSEGRAFLGIGAAWYEREHLGLGAPFPALGVRFELLEEALQIAMQMWSDDNGPFEGDHYKLAETLCVPQPIQRPRPPIMVAGSGERKTLRLVALYADACNLFGTSVEDVQHKLEVLRGHCDNESRDYDAIEKTMLGRFDPLGDTDAFLAEMERYAAIGVDHVHFSAPAPDPAGWVAEYAEKVVPRLSEIGG